MVVGRIMVRYVNPFIHSFTHSLNHVIDDSIIESLLCAGLWSRYVRFRHQNLRPVQGFESILSL